MNEAEREVAMGDAERGGPCRVTDVALPRAVRGLRLENGLLAATVLPDKGADIYELIHQPSGVDVLWKSPWGLRRPGGYPSAFDSNVTWIEAYEGGWQEIFPSGGGPCTYKGVELNFHGEASMSAWDAEITQAAGNAAEVRLTVRLARSPFRIERTMRVEAGRPVLTLRERITNEGGEAMDYMWSHHPALGAPFLSGTCRIDTNARILHADDAFDGPSNPLAPAQTYDWPTVERNGERTDLSRVPGEDVPRAILAYFADYAGDTAWYGVTNPDLGLAVGFAWAAQDFPHAWFWQEMHASAEFPWYKGVYVMAIEPATTIPGQGLVAAMEKSGTHRTLAPGASAAAELRAVFAETRQGVAGIAADGTVSVKEEARG